MDERIFEIKITADTSEFEESIDSCIAKVKELIQLFKQTDKLLDDNIRSQSQT